MKATNKKTQALLGPLAGARILFDSKQKPYEMPIRPLSAKARKAMSGCKTAAEIYRCWEKNNEALSIRDQIAILQAAVLSNSRHAASWHSLACSYELEGKDWFAATNAWNHVVFLRPTSAVAWFSLSQLWEYRGMKAKALECNARFEALQAKSSKARRPRTKKGEQGEGTTGLLGRLVKWIAGS